LKEDSRPVIRGTAAWALGKIGDTRVISDLEEASKTEKDPEVLAEIEKGLQLLRSNEEKGKNRSPVT
ncbi:HEAT repeat domain-containing protein, partial [Parageobacillus sp. SY1]